MIAFSDDDLKQFKACVERNDYFGGWSLKALITRLEAAEKAIIPTYCDEEETDYSDVYKAWRKAAGK